MKDRETSDSEHAPRELSPWVVLMVISIIAGICAMAMIGTDVQR